MDKAQFWRLMEDAKKRSGGDCEAQAELLRSSLLLLPAEAIAAFDKIFNEMRAVAYRWDLWGAAYLINGGGSDDGFEYFRWWLIGQGQATFEAALADPDSLADLIQDNIVWSDGEVECEEIGYAALAAYKEKTGQEMPAVGYIHKSEPDGVQWEEADLDALFPRIVAKINLNTAE